MNPMKINYDFYSINKGVNKHILKFDIITGKTTYNRMLAYSQFTIGADFICSTKYLLQ